MDRRFTLESGLPAWTWACAKRRLENEHRTDVAIRATLPRDIKVE